MADVRIEHIEASDGTGSFAGTVTLPESGSGPGLLLLQEIFGVNDYIRDVGRRLAELGYVTLAPDMFWRIEPGVALGHEDADLARGMQLAQQFDGAKGAEDLGAALEHLRGLDEIDGGVGAIGFCFGGTMAYLAAAMHDPDVAISYYGSGVSGMLDRADRVTCPILFHFGLADPFLPEEQARQVTAAFADRDNAEWHLHEGAGHAFDNSFSKFSQPEHAGAAWSLTANFLFSHLPTA